MKRASMVGILVAILMLAPFHADAIITVKGIRNIDKYGPFIIVPSEILLVGGTVEAVEFLVADEPGVAGAFSEIDVSGVPGATYSTDFESYLKIFFSPAFAPPLNDEAILDISFITSLPGSFIEGDATPFNFKLVGPAGSESGALTYAAPEPGTLSLLALAAAGCMWRSRQRGGGPAVEGLT